MKMRNIQGGTLEYNTPEFTVLSTTTHFNYFCLKLSCFFAWHSKTADPEMCCSKCGESKDVVGRLK